MKTWIFSMCVGVFCLIYRPSFAQTFPFKITGTLKNISPMPGKMYLKALGSGLLKEDSDSASVINGRFSFQGQLNVDEAVMVQISTEPKMTNTNGYTVFIDKGELEVVSDGKLGKIVVTGTAAAAQQEKDDFENNLDKEKQELERITQTEQYKTDQQLQAEVLERSRQLPNKAANILYSFIKNNPEKRSTPFDAYMLVALLQKGKIVDTIVASLPEHVRNDRLGQAIMHVGVLTDSLAKVNQAKSKADAGKVQVGGQAPDFTQPNVNNKTVSLSSFKGKYVLVDFWASWCAPCRAENPNVVKAYNKYKEKGFTVLGVSLDAEASRAAWLKAIAADGLTWTEVSDLKGWKNEAAVAYGVSSIPQNFLIDPNGVVIAKNLRGDELNAKLASLFK